MRTRLGQLCELCAWRAHQADPGSAQRKQPIRRVEAQRGGRNPNGLRPGSLSSPTFNVLKILVATCSARPRLQWCRKSESVSNEGETTATRATKASKRCHPSRNASVSAGVVQYRRGDASHAGCSSFFPSMGTRPGNPGIFLKILQLYAPSHMYNVPSCTSAH